MSLHLITGGSGSGKSEYIYKKIIQQSMDNPDKNYIVVVPEQYTMQTQKKLVEKHPRKGILNIDVVSFERLAYKVFEEIGGENRQTIDDTGKNLIVRKVLGDNKRKLKFFGGSINKLGFVSEIKSIISEFMQYDISSSMAAEIGNNKDINNRLSYKMADIAVVYEAFLNYLSDNYITNEEIPDVLCNVITQSVTTKKSDFVFDGFTGFTPVQYRLIEKILMLSEHVYVTVTIDSKEKLNVYEGMHNLFFMSKIMVQKLYKLCDDNHIKIEKPVVLSMEKNPRFVSDGISYLEKNIFRSYGKCQELKDGSIIIYNSMTPKEEVQFIAGEIIRLTRFENYRYADIAVVTGDISLYGRLCTNIFEQNNIPAFIDTKRNIMDNPIVEYIRSAIEIIESRFEYDSMFRYLRSGLTGMERDVIDELQNYCVAVGIRGKKMWNSEWTRKGSGRNAYRLNELNQYREKILEPLAVLDEEFHKKDVTVKDYIAALYDFIVNTNGCESLSKIAEKTEKQDEYRLVYKKVIDLFDKVVELLGQEKLGIREFSKILDSGLSELKVGLIPQVSDCIMVGDIERTRLDNVKIMFVAGVNEGVIPGKNENSGILSEADRDVLGAINITLSPDARQKAFIQKFYLYLMLTKASDKLYLTYSDKGEDGKSIMPSYLIKNIKKMFSDMEILSKEKVSEAFTYIKIPRADISYGEKEIREYIDNETAEIVYSDELKGSISAYETYAECAFRYFLQYGLGIQENEEYSFEVADFGSVLHKAIEESCRTLWKDKKTPADISDIERRRLACNVIESVSEGYLDDILNDSARSMYLKKRMIDLADRTLWAIGRQFQNCQFKPYRFEYPFSITEDPVKTEHGEKGFKLNGKIDRIDICNDNENVYVRIIDYKTGNDDFNLLDTYYGLKLQLMTYMSAAIEYVKKEFDGKSVVPAGVFYYNIKDPIVDDKSQSEQDTENDILKELRLNGRVNDNKDIAELMDSEVGSSSMIIPVGFKKDGEFNSNSKIMNTEQFNNLVSYVNAKEREMAKEIVDGCIKISPIKESRKTSCDYCPYKAVCGFEPGLGNMTYRKKIKMSEEDIWQNIKDRMKKDGKSLDGRAEESN